MIGLLTAVDLDEEKDQQVAEWEEDAAKSLESNDAAMGSFYITNR